MRYKINQMKKYSKILFIPVVFIFSTCAVSTQRDIVDLTIAVEDETIELGPTSVMDLILSLEQAHEASGKVEKLKAKIKPRVIADRVDLYDLISDEKYRDLFTNSFIKKVSAVGRLRDDLKEAEIYNIIDYEYNYFRVWDIAYGPDFSYNLGHSESDGTKIFLNSLELTKESSYTYPVSAHYQFEFTAGQNHWQLDDIFIKIQGFSNESFRFSELMKKTARRMTKDLRAHGLTPNKNMMGFQ